MKYRKITSEEIPVWRQFEEYCFNVAPADFDPWIEQKLEIEHTRALFDDQGQMLATCVNWPWEIHFEGERMRMGGIASVASLPENRRGGHVGEMLVQLIREMKENGTPISALYPFKQSFYRRYGWEVSSAFVEQDLPVELLLPYRKQSGEIRRYLPDQANCAELASIYDRWAAPLRGRMVRPNERHWRNWVLSPGAKIKYHTAVYAPARGAEPEGYLLYRFDKDDQGRGILLVRELVAQTVEATRALLGYVANHDSQVKIVRFRHSRTFPIWHLLENTYETRSTLNSTYQLRIIDVKSAFEGRPWPVEAKGSLVLGVKDEHAPWNAGPWRISFEEGRASVSPAPGTESDMTTDIGTLSQLFASFVTPAAAQATGRLISSSAPALRLLTLATAGDELFFTEFF